MFEAVGGEAATLVQAPTLVQASGQVIVSGFLLRPALVRTQALLFKTDARSAFDVGFLHI